MRVYLTDEMSCLSYEENLPHPFILSLARIVEWVFPDGDFPNSGFEPFYAGGGIYRIP